MNLRNSANSQVFEGIYQIPRHLENSSDSKVFGEFPILIIFLIAKMTRMAR